EACPLSRYSRWRAQSCSACGRQRYRTQPHERGVAVVLVPHRLTEPFSPRQNGSVASAPARVANPAVTIVIPVLNEAHVLEKSVETVRAFLTEGARFPYPWELLIADNGSVDGTQEVARALSRKHAEVK